MSLQHTLARMALAATLSAACAVASAQGAYPNKPIKIIAPVQPGGGVDLVARTIGERIGKAARPQSGDKLHANGVELGGEPA